MIRYVAILLSVQLTVFAGDHRGVVIPVPIPNTEVKGSIAKGSAPLGRARVGRRRLFFMPAGHKKKRGLKDRAYRTKEIEGGRKAANVL